MTKENFGLKIIKLITVFTVLFFSMCFFVYLSKDCTVFDDDFFYSTYQRGENIFDCLKFSFGHGGGYPGCFFSKFFTQGLPLLFGIHPCDFAGIPHALIKGIFLVLILLITSFFIKTENKKNNLFIPSLIVCSLYFFDEAFKVNSYIFCVSYNFYRYVFSFLFTAPFLLFLFKSFTNSAYAPKAKQIILFSICAYVSGTSSEISFFALTFLICASLSYTLFIFLLEKLLNVNFEKYKLKINKCIIIPVAIFFVSVFLFTHSDGYLAVSNQRSVSNFKEYIPVFNPLFFTVCFKSHCFYWFIYAFSLLVHIYFSVKNKDFYKIIFNVFIQTSTLAVMYSLVYCGDSFYGASYIENSQVRLIYSLWLLYPLLILFSYLSNFKKISFALSFILIISSILTVKDIPFSYADYKNNMPSSFSAKQELYKIDKTARFYYLQDKIPLLPSDGRYFFFGLQSDNVQKSDLYMNDDRYSLDYYPLTYFDNTSVTKGIYVIENAFELNSETGVFFSEDELKNIKFSRLYNSDFVLNKITISQL